MKLTLCFIFLFVIFSDCANLPDREPKMVPFKLNKVKYVEPDDIPPQFGAGYAQEGNFTYMLLALYSSEEDPEKMISCSATLIDKNWVLIAANCFSGNLKPKSSSVILAGGTIDLNPYIKKREKTPFCDEVKVENVQERRANYIYVHELYKEKTKEHDIALIRLRKPFRMGRTISTIPLSYNKMKSSMEKCTILRWGRPSNDIKSYLLMYSDDMSAQTIQEGCQYKKEGDFICLKRDTAICHGEAGSPLICSGKVWGIASHLYARKATLDCEGNLEEYYTEVFANFVWLMQTLAKPPEVHPDPSEVDTCNRDNVAATKSVPSIISLFLFTLIIRYVVKS